MILTERQHIKVGHSYYKECDLLCRASKNLYNTAIYTIKQYYATNNRYFFTLNDKKVWIFSLTYLYQQLKSNDCYKTENHPAIKTAIAGRVCNQVLKQVNTDFSNYFKSLKEYNINPSKYPNGKPKAPSYARDRKVCTFEKQAINKKGNTGGHFKLSMTNIEIPFCDKYNFEQIKEVKIVPCTSGYDIIVCYDDGITVEPVCDYNDITKICGLDLGISNLATVVCTDPSVETLIINGNPLKSINQQYNKNLAYHKSKLPKKVYTSKKIRTLTQKRNNQVHEYMHQATSRIIDHLLKNGIECLVFGYNKNWKQNVNLGKKTNQNFVCIPFLKFKNMLKYKCEKYGIWFVETEESYTSKCSFLDNESIKKHSTYMGRRKSRGLYVDSKGTKINADANGAYNIIRKVFDDSYFDMYRTKYSSVHIRKISKF